MSQCDPKERFDFSPGLAGDLLHISWFIPCISHHFCVTKIQTEYVEDFKTKVCAIPRLVSKLSHFRDNFIVVVVID